MLSLQQLQYALQSYILTGDSKINANIVGSSQTFLTERLQIYREGYEMQLQAILAKNYPYLNLLVTDSLFAEIAQAYIQHYPPTDFAGCRYGDKLSLFLQTTPPYDEQPVFAEMAQFIAALNAALYASSEPVAVPADLTKLAPSALPEAQFEVSTALRMLNLQFNTLELWEAMHKNSPLPAVRRSAAAVDIVIWRRGFKSCYKQCTIAELAVISALGKQASFAQVCQILCDFVPEEQVPETLAVLLLGFLQEGMITKIKATPG